MINGHYKDNFFYLEDINEINLGTFGVVSSDNVPEATVDSKCTELFKNNLDFSDSEVRHQSTRIQEIDNNIPSKNNYNERGFADVYIVQNEQLKVLIEDKIPTVNSGIALEESIYYCNALRNNGIDIRISIGYNGTELQFRVFSGTSEGGDNIWSPFYINGVEFKAFPSKDIISLIYKYNNLKGILEDRSPRSKKIVHSSIEKLRGIYRQLAFIQNDNNTTIDFTIAFISLKSISEKHSELYEDTNHVWNNLYPASPTGNPLVGLQNNIAGLMDWICNEERQNELHEERKDSEVEGNVNLYNFSEIFLYKTKDRNFNFKTLVKEFKTSNLIKLKEIYNIVNDMPELHSSKIDLFGEVYELLADKKTKKSFGQYFTGRHIIKPLIKILFEQNGFSEHITGGINEEGVVINPKKICDPACGTGGFLTEAFKYIDNELKEEGVIINVNDFASKAFYGFDIHSQNTTKTKINMYLAGDGFSEIKDRDSLLSMPQRYHNYFDYIITNPPYGDDSPIIDASIINSQRLEINFIIKIVKMLKKGGKGLLIIPDGVLESPSLSHFREWLLRNCCINKIIGLPKFSFAPYTKEKTYALYITKRESPLETTLDSIKNEEIWFYIVDNDGFANSDKRFQTNRKNINGAWLHDELSSWIDQEGIENNSIIETALENKDQDSDEEYFNEWGKKIEGKKYGRVKLKEIFKNEFVYYSTIPKSEIKKMLTQLPKLNEILEEELDKISVKLIENIYYDLDKIKHKKMTVAEIKQLLPNMTNKKDLITSSGNFNQDYNLNLSEYGYLIKEQKNGLAIDIWKISEDTYTEIKDFAIISKYKNYLHNNDLMIKDLSELLDSDNNLKEQYKSFFETENIYYDIEDEKFYNHAEKLSKKLLYLIPEKYFRGQDIKTVELETYKRENNSLIVEIKDKLSELLGTL